MQVLTGTIPFGRKTGPEVVIKVLGGVRPSKPTNALDLGLSDDVWELLEDSWQTEREQRLPVKDVLVRVKLAASTCGILSPVDDVVQLSPVGGVVQRYDEPDSDFTMFGTSLSWLPSDVGFKVCHRSTVPWDGHR